MALPPEQEAAGTSALATCPRIVLEAQPVRGKDSKRPNGRSTVISITDSTDGDRKS